MENAFESTLKQAKESELKVKIKKKKNQPVTKTRPVKKVIKKSIKKSVVMSPSQQNNNLTVENNISDLKSIEQERKTFYLTPDLAKIFKYAKFKINLGESEIANIALENYFKQQFGKNWRDLLKS